MLPMLHMLNAIRLTHAQQRLHPSDQMFNELNGLIEHEVAAAFALARQGEVFTADEVAAGFDMAQNTTELHGVNGSRFVDFLRNSRTAEEYIPMETLPVGAAVLGDEEEEDDDVSD